jgi:hypothetical protein
MIYSHPPSLDWKIGHENQLIFLICVTHQSTYKVNADQWLFIIFVNTPIDENLLEGQG